MIYIGPTNQMYEIWRVGFIVVAGNGEFLLSGYTVSVVKNEKSSRDSGDIYTTV